MEECRISDIAEADIRIAYTASFPEIQLTLSIGAESKEMADKALAQANDKVRTRLAQFLVAEDDDSLAARVLRRLEEKELQIAFAEC